MKRKTDTPARRKGSAAQRRPDVRKAGGGLDRAAGRQQSVAGAFGRKLKKERKPLPPKKSGIQVPPALPVPLRREDGSLQIREAVLEFVCGVTSAVPETQLPEFAFAGKSNVGKSSLLNALVNRKALARTSAQPGKTQTINFYRVNGSFYLVDLPGYGYANAGEQAKAAWGKMIENYLHTAPRLKAVFLLVDIRHVPSENDCLMYEWIARQELKPLIIATKADKIKRSQLKKQEKMIRETLGCAGEIPVIPFSSETKRGREEVFSQIEALTARG